MNLPPKIDTLVIGGGLFGCAAAYFLARFGVETLVIERAGIGAGASGATAGNLHLQLSTSTYVDKSEAWIRSFSGTIPFFQAGVAYWSEIAAELQADIELRNTGGLMVAQTPDQLETLRSKVAVERAQGLDIQLLSRTDVAELAPYLNTNVIGASWCPGEGMANPMLSVAAFADAARLAGARFVTGTSVDALQQQGSAWLAQTDRGSVSCRRIVIAAGHGSEELAARLGLDLGLTKRVIQMAATEACVSFIPHLVYHAEERLTMKQAANGNVLMGGGWSAALDPIYARPSVLRQSLEQALGVASDVVPAIRTLNLLRSWSGYNVYTPNGRPTLGPVPGRPGLFVALCNTYGFTLGPLCARLIAECVAGLPPSWDMAPFAVNRVGA